MGIVKKIVEKIWLVVAVHNITHRKTNPSVIAELALIFHHITPEWYQPYTTQYDCCNRIGIRNVGVRFAYMSTRFGI